MHLIAYKWVVHTLECEIKNALIVFLKERLYASNCLKVVCSVVQDGSTTILTRVRF